MKKYAAILCNSSGKELRRWEVEAEDESKGLNKAYEKFLFSFVKTSAGDGIKFAEVGE
jgi:hypothetical protein